MSNDSFSWRDYTKTILGRQQRDFKPCVAKPWAWWTTYRWAKEAKHALRGLCGRQFKRPPENVNNMRRPVLTSNLKMQKWN
jgi:hypothetical protein